MSEFIGQSTCASIPQLEPHCGSWIVTSPEGAVRELFERSNVERAVAAGWTVETTASWLGRKNREERGKAEREVFEIVHRGGLKP